MNKFENKIYDKFKDKYEQITKKSFEKFFKKIFLDLESDNNREFSINYLMRKTIKPTKKRWINIVINDKENTFNKDIQYVKIQYDKVLSGEITIDMFKSFFSVINLDEYEKKQLNKLNDWAMNDDIFLTDFKFLEEIKNISISSAFKNDIYLYYLLCLQNKCKDDDNLATVPLMKIPIDTTGKAYYLSESEKSKLDKVLDINSISTLEKLVSLGGEEKEEIVLSLERKTYLAIKNGANSDKFLDMMAQIVLLKSIKYLNSYDIKVINYYYNHFINMLTGDPVIKSLYQILTEMGLPTSQYYFDELENSLAKLGSMSISYKFVGNALYGTFLNCFIYKEDDGVKRARVNLGVLKDLILKDQTFEYDKDVYNKLSSISQQIGVWLQNRRYKLGIKNGTNFENIDIKSFYNVIYFSTKRADRIRKRIIDSLEELKLKNLTIKNYNYNKRLDIIEIEYIELTKKERKKLGILDDIMIVKPTTNIE